MNHNGATLIRRALLTILGVVVVIYGIIEARRLIEGPIISVSSPLPGETFSQPLIEVTGTAENTTEVTLDGRPVFTDTKGIFQEKLLLSPGYNIIEIDARDRFNRKKTRTIEVILKEY